MKRYDFSKVDFETMTTSEIMKLSGLSRSQIIALRQFLGVRKFPRKFSERRKKILSDKWKSADFENKRDVKIAKEFGCSRENVRQKRIIYETLKNPELFSHIPFGEKTDAELSKEFGISKLKIKLIRETKGIEENINESFSKVGLFLPIDFWEDVPDSMFETKTMVEIAEMKGCSCYQVSVEKKRRGIKRRVHFFKYNFDQFKDLLGKMSDVKLAKIVGCVPRTVSIKRIGLNIPSFYDIDWNKFDNLLGTDVDKKIAEKIGVSVASVLNRRRKLNIPAFTKKIDWSKFDNLLGTDVDKKIAKKIGHCQMSVLNRRKKLGIPAFKKEKFDWDSVQLGILPDKEIAKTFGYSINTVILQRYKRGIFFKRWNK